MKSDKVVRKTKSLSIHAAKNNLLEILYKIYLKISLASCASLFNHKPQNQTNGRGNTWPRHLSMFGASVLSRHWP